MTICFICCEYPPVPHGGIGSFVQTLGRSFVRDGHKVRVIGLYNNSEDFPAYEEDRGVQVWRLPCGPQRLAWVPARIRLFRTIRGWARRGEIDIVEVPDWEGYAAGWPRVNVPVVVRLHGSHTYFASEMSEPITKRAVWMEARAFHRADYCCSTSIYTAKKTNQLFGTRPDPIEVLYSPIHLRPAKAPMERDPNMVVFAGTLTRKKGIAQLVKAWPRVLALHPHAVLHVYGKDAELNKEQLLALLDNGSAKTVQFHGHIPTAELRNVYECCRMAVFPSYAEAFALAPIEAMAESCPVVYSKRHSGRELITHEHDGLLAEPDDEEDIASCVLRLLKDDELAQRLGRRARELVERRFAPERVVARNLEFYGQCVSHFQ